MSFFLTRTSFFLTRTSFFLTRTSSFVTRMSFFLTRMSFFLTRTSSFVTRTSVRLYESLQRCPFWHFYCRIVVEHRLELLNCDAVFQFCLSDSCAD